MTCFGAREPLGAHRRGTFKGCYISYADDPWSGNDLAFFVDTETGFSVLAETRWSE